MSKKVKIIIGIVVAICVIAAAIVGGYFGIKQYEKSKYTIDYVKNMLKEGNDDNKYVHVKTEWLENDKSASVTEVARDGQKLYIHEGGDSQEGYDALCDFENSKQYIIYHAEKVIMEASTVSVNTGYIDIFMKQINESALQLLNEENSKLEYCEKTKVNGDKCIKVSVSSEENGTNEKVYLYIRLKDKCIVKMESEDDTGRQELVVNYYNDVDSEFAKKFDVDSYTDYERQEAGI